MNPSRPLINRSLRTISSSLFMGHCVVRRSKQIGEKTTYGGFIRRHFNVSAAQSATGVLNGTDRRCDLSFIRRNFNVSAADSATGVAGRRKMTAMELARRNRAIKGDPENAKRISMVTAYNYPQALHLDLAGIDICLVGDSLAMVELGHETTQQVTVEEMLHHTRAVARGAQHPLIVGDMPMGSYEVSPEQALETAYRFVKEGNADCVKLEGGKERSDVIRKIVSGGVAVMAHIGLTPQSISVLGGFRAQGRTAVKARALLDDALSLQDAGAFAVVIECVPPVVAEVITEALEIPTIGIGSGPHTSGQVLVFHDMLGMCVHPHFSTFTPKFCKHYANLGAEISQGLEQYKREVETGTFPSLETHSPYKMSDKEVALFREMVSKDSKTLQSKTQSASDRLRDADEYESVGLYGGKKV
eukprot:g4865.t1